MRKLLISILAVGLSAAFIYGATMAWFTDEKNVTPATFTAGTVDVTQRNYQLLSEYNADNVNPGDTFTPTWTFYNTGTKAIQVRIVTDISYTPSREYQNEILDTSNIDTKFAPDSSKWVKIWEDLDKNDSTPPVLVLYLGEMEGDTFVPTVIPGTYTNGINTKDTEARKFVLSIEGTFNGAKTTNKYQGSKLTVGGTVQVIQASHDDQWSWADFSTYNPKPSTPAAE